VSLSFSAYCIVAGIQPVKVLPQQLPKICSYDLASSGATLEKFAT